MMSWQLTSAHYPYCYWKMCQNGRWYCDGWIDHSCRIASIEKHAAGQSQFNQPTGSLAKIGYNAFTITFTEDSDYTRETDVAKGVKITTKETFKVDGDLINKFHTTRVAIAKKFDERLKRWQAP